MEKRTKMIVYRKHLELTQCKLADMIGVTHQAISRWENGLGFPRPAIAIRLADALGTTVEDLFGKRRRHHGKQNRKPNP